MLGIVPLSEETKINTWQVLLCSVFSSVRDRCTLWYNKSLTVGVSPLKHLKMIHFFNAVLAAEPLTVRSNCP